MLQAVQAADVLTKRVPFEVLMGGIIHSHNDRGPPIAQVVLFMLNTASGPLPLVLARGEELLK